MTNQQKNKRLCRILHKRLFLELLAGLEPNQELLNAFIYNGFSASRPFTTQFFDFVFFLLIIIVNLSNHAEKCTIEFELEPA